MWLLVCVALSLRFCAVLALRDVRNFHGARTEVTDAVEFKALAQNLAAGEVAARLSMGPQPPVANAAAVLL